MTSPIPSMSIDVHAHIFPTHAPAHPTSGGPWPTLRTGADRGQIMLGDRVFREVPATLWSLEQRLAHMDDKHVELQLVSPVPVTLTYGNDARATATYMTGLNEAIAEQVRASMGRLMGLGAVPMQDTNLAIRELEHLVRDLGLLGVEIGTVIPSKELDDPSLADFFAAAADLGARVFVHPIDGGAGAIRRSGQPYDFGLGMLTDTALATGALVFGGILERHPDLQVLLAHGGGTFSWAYPRLRLMAATSDSTDFDPIVSRLHVDSLVFDPTHLPVLGHRFGCERIMLGTDFPFFPQQESTNVRMVEEWIAREGSSPAQVTSLVRENALRFLGR